MQMQKDLANADPLLFAADETTDYTYDANDRLLTEITDVAVAADDRNTRYAYNGTEQIGKTEREGLLIDSGNLVKTTANTYNLQGRLETVETDSDGDGDLESRATYRYNDSGIRVYQKIETDTDADGTLDEIVETLYVVDPNNPTGYAQVLEEGTDADGDGRLQAAEIEKSFTLGQDVISQQAPGIENGNTLFFLYDGHGSTRALVTEAATVVQTYAYDAYGNAIGFDPAVAYTSLLYSGEWFQADVGMQYLRARWYDPASGRFNRLDPFAGLATDPQSLHKYLYTHGDPVNNVDPSGEVSLGGLVSGIGARISVSAVRIGSAFSALRTTQAFVRIANFSLRVRRFFWDPRAFQTISRQFWVARGGAAGRSLHHWLLPQRAAWIPQGLRNAGINLLNMPRILSGPLGLNQWMGFALRWGGQRMVVAVFVERGIRVAIPLASYASYSAGRYVGDEIADEIFELEDGVEAVPLNLSGAQLRELENSANGMLDQLENASTNTDIVPVLD